MLRPCSSQEFKGPFGSRNRNGKGNGNGKDNEKGNGNGKDNSNGNGNGNDKGVWSERINIGNGKSGIENCIKLL